MSKGYRVSVNGRSSEHQTAEEAITAAEEYAAKDGDAAIKVFNKFNNVIWEN